MTLDWGLSTSPLVQINAKQLCHLTILAQYYWTKAMGPITG